MEGHRIDRRTLLKKAAVGTGALFAWPLLSACSSPPSPKPPAIPTVIPDVARFIPDIKTEVTNKNFDLFNDKELNEIAKNKGLGLYEFFLVPNKIYPKLKAFHEAKELLPLFSPATHEYTELLYRMAKKHNLPVNMFAQIVDVESTGYFMAETRDLSLDQNERAKYDANGNFIPKRACGLAQVLNYNMINNGFADREDWFDPEINLNLGSILFTKDFLGWSNQRWGESDSAAHRYVRGSMGYNAGFYGVTENYEDLPFETQLYGDHITRGMIMMEFAQALRDKGYDNAAILKKLSDAASEINIRIRAINAFRTELVRVNQFTPAAYQRATVALAKDQVDDSVPLLKSYYDAFKRAPIGNGYVNPGLLMLRAMGMEDKYLKSSVNAYFKDEQWLKINTKRAYNPQVVPDNTIFFNQLSKRWKGGANWGTGRANCAPTAVAMLIKRFAHVFRPYREDVNPVFINDIFLYQGFRTNSEADTLVRERSTHDHVLGWLEKLGYEVVQVSDGYLNPNKRFNFEEAKKMIDQGYLILASGWPYKLNGSHVFLISDVFLGSNTMTMADPWDGVSRRVELKDFMNGLDYSYAVRPRQN